MLSFLAESFEAFGGVPKTVLTDNMKTIMDESRTEHQKGKINERFFQFAKDMGFEVKPCIAGRLRTKGQIDEVLHNQTRSSVIESITVITQGTGKIPILALKKERNLLSPLPHERIRSFYKIEH